MHFDTPVSCGNRLSYRLDVVLSCLVDRLCTTKCFIDRFYINMIDNVICGSFINHKSDCVSENEKHDSQTNIGFAVKN